MVRETGRPTRSRRLEAFRPWFAPAYGLSIAGSYAAAWLLLERAATGRFWFATSAFALAALLAGYAAQLGMRLLPARRFWTRFSAALPLLLVFTATFAALAIFLDRAIGFEWPQLSLAHAIWWIVTAALSSAYLFLVVPGRLLIPVGVPAILAFAALLAASPRRPR